MSNPMKKFLIILAILFPAAARADDAADEILVRYNVSLAKAKQYCPGLSEKIDFVKMLAGISVAGTAVGTLGGGTAVVAGYWKASNDGKINKEPKPAEQEALAEQLLAKVAPNTITDDESIQLTIITEWIMDNGKDDYKKIKDAEKLSGTLGGWRTAGAITAGVGGAVGTAAFGGLKTLDNLVVEMNACDSYVQEISKQAAELRIAAPDNPAIAAMDDITKNCKGMSSKNIATIKGNMLTAGIISAVGAAAGVVGGIASVDANKKDKEKRGNGANTVANVSSIAATAGNIGGVIFSGLTLSGLIKNGDIAAKCKAAF